ncbi:MAG: hypothetical protein IT379_17335 [Deltaproteobacteria bacterium]|nr:hypothetical protein [Deltaproteobacteria bacterium]
MSPNEKTVALVVALALAVVVPMRVEAQAQPNAGGGAQPTPPAGQPTTPPETVPPTPDGTDGTGEGTDPNAPAEVPDEAPEDVAPEEVEPRAPVEVAPEEQVARAATEGDGPHSDAVDVRLSWTFGDDDILAGTGEVVPVSPMAGIGDRPGYSLFFDNLNSAFSSRENLAHLVLYRRMNGFWPNWSTDASFVLRVNLEELNSIDPRTNRILGDSGSFLRVQYRPWAEAPEDGVSFVLFPFDTERFRLGYLYELSYGGSDFIPRRRFLRSPGLKLQLDRGIGYYYLGFKTILAQEALDIEIEGGGGTEIETVRIDETQYAFLAGAGWDFTETVRLDIGGGYFQQGRFDLTGYPQDKVYSFGGSMRLVLHDGISVGNSVDFRLYTNDPESPFVPFRLETYEAGRLAWSASLEGAAIAQHVADTDAVGSTSLQTGFAGAFGATLKYGFLRLDATVLVRTLPFILKNVPSLVPFLSVPDVADVTPETFFALEGSYHLPDAHLTLRLGGGLQLPATVTIPFTSDFAESSRVQVIRREGSFSILPPGEGSVPIIQARLAARLDLSNMMFVQAWVQYVRDNNGTRLETGADGTRTRSFQSPDQMGLGITAAARF